VVSPERHKALMPTMLLPQPSCPCKALARPGYEHLASDCASISVRPFLTTWCRVLPASSHLFCKSCWQGVAMAQVVI